MATQLQLSARLQEPGDLPVLTDAKRVWPLLPKSILFGINNLRDPDEAPEFPTRDQTAKDLLLPNRSVQGWIK